MALPSTLDGMSRRFCGRPINFQSFGSRNAGFAGTGNSAAAGAIVANIIDRPEPARSEEHTSELQSLLRISYAVFCLKKKSKESLTNKPERFDNTSTNTY